ncbi:MAG: ABC transporter permease, partial [Bacteroidota bacterium]
RRFRNRQDISLRQATELKRRLTTAEHISLINQSMGAIVRYGTESTDPSVSIYGCDESFVNSYDYVVDQGRSIEVQDVQLRSDVVVIGAELADKFFKNGSPLGKSIAINGHRFTVVGTLQAKGAVFGQSQDNLALVPITSAAKYFFDEMATSLTISIRSASVSAMEETIGQTVGILRSIRGVPLGAPNDFEITTNESISQTFGNFTKYVSQFGLGCGVIALIAAGVGIMNIMLVSVKERTREIGIRKAVGATNANILTQFVVEAVTLCQLGALIGILIGLGMGLLMSIVVKVTPPFPWDWVLISIGACTFIGLLFGIYPAWQASRLDPIDALRYE